ncbi:MAG TPA: TolC family protein [Coleofasciculaceae cyanobacterium]|jgi:outer membrane protein TolC
MQPPTSLITLGLGAAVALCAAAPTQAAPLVIRQASADLTHVKDKKTALLATARSAAEAGAIAPAKGQGATLYAQNPQPEEPQPEESQSEKPQAEESQPEKPQAEESPSMELPQAEESQAEESPSMELPQAAPEDPGEDDASSAADTGSSDEPAPEYLNPDPNPLSFPTQPEEVQIVGTQPLTLKQTIELAIRNSRSLQESRLTLERTQAALREAEAQNLPTVSANADLTFSAQDQAVTNATGTGFDGTRSTNSTSLSAAVQASYALFTSGQRSASIRASAGQVRFQELQLESDTEQLILDVTNNYYDLQGTIEQVRIARDTLTQAEQSLRDAQALERAGVGTRFDVLQAEVDRANAEQDLTQQISQQEIARRQIVQQLGLSQSVDITAADPIVPAGVWDLSLEQSIVLAYRNRAELEQQLVQREISVQNRRRALAQLKPQVTLQASSGVSRTLDTNQGLVYEGFLPNFSAAVGVNWTIFDGGQSRAQADQSEANIAIAENQFASNREQIRFQVEQAYSTLRSSFDNIQVTALAVQNATEALRLARLRFQAGVGTQTDVLQQQTALTQAEVNSLTAILNYNRALASLQRQISNFPEGNLADTP